MIITVDNPHIDQVNTDALLGLAIYTSFGQAGWSPDTRPEECWTPEFVRDIQTRTYGYLEWVLGKNSLVVSQEDILQAIWALDEVSL